MSNQELVDDLIAQRAEITANKNQAKKDGNQELVKKLTANYLAITMKITYYKSIANNPDYLKNKMASSEKSRKKMREDCHKYRQLVSIISAV